MKYDRAVTELDRGQRKCSALHKSGRNVAGGFCDHCRIFVTCRLVFVCCNLLYTGDKISRSVVAAPKVVTSRYMQAAAAKGPMKADRVSFLQYLCRLYAYYKADIFVILGSSSYRRECHQLGLSVAEAVQCRPSDLFLLWA